MPKLTIYDISRLAGVSISTVSRVLNGNPHVDPATRQKVQEVVKQYNYVPRQEARNFAQRNPFAVGLLVDDVRHAYMAELAHAIVDQLAKWKINTVLCTIADVEHEFIDTVDTLLAKKVGGIILIGPAFENVLCRVAVERRYSSVHFVTVNANFALPNVCEITQDHLQGASDAVRYLFGQGRRRIGYVYHDRSPSDHKKRRGYLQGMAACGLRGNRIVRTTAPTMEEGYQATEALMARYPDTDAILYSSDALAVGGVHCLNQAGTAIPRQVALVGFNNAQRAKDCWPQLSSVDNRVVDSGRTAALMMVNLLARRPAESRMLVCRLVLRQSTEGHPTEHVWEGEGLLP